MYWNIDAINHMSFLLQVREMASVTLSGAIQCNFLDANDPGLIVSQVIEPSTA